jgi:hypothetical protein
LSRWDQGSTESAAGGEIKPYGQEPNRNRSGKICKIRKAGCQGPLRLSRDSLASPLDSTARDMFPYRAPGEPPTLSWPATAATAVDPGMPTAMRSLGFLGVLSSTPAASSVARLVSTPVCAASLPNLVRNAGWAEASHAADRTAIFTLTRDGRCPHQYYHRYAIPAERLHRPAQLAAAGCRRTFGVVSWQRAGYSPERRV